MNLRTARVQSKPGLRGKTLPIKQPPPPTKTRSQGPKESFREGGSFAMLSPWRWRIQAVRFFFLGQGSGVRYLVLFGTRGLGYSRMGYVLYLSLVQICG